MERKDRSVQRPTEKHPFKGMQDRSIEARPHPNVVFDRTVRGALTVAGADTKVVEAAMPDIVRAADQRQRDIGALTGLEPDYELQALLGDVPPPKGGAL